MCDALSLASAGNDLVGGALGASDARSMARFEAAQIDAMKTLAGARASAEEGAMRRAFTAHANQNMAAMAVSGLAAASFSTVEAGNDAELQRNLRTNQRNAQTEIAGLDIQKQMVLAEGKSRALVAMMGGFTRARSTLYDAERGYRDNNTGQTRREYLMRSVRGS
jgi:hypothetical protein